MPHHGPKVATGNHAAKYLWRSPFPSVGASLCGTDMRQRTLDAPVGIVGITGFCQQAVLFTQRRSNEDVGSSVLHTKSWAYLAEM